MEHLLTMTALQDFGVPVEIAAVFAYSCVIKVDTILTRSIAWPFWNNPTLREQENLEYSILYVP